MHRSIALASLSELTPRLLAFASQFGILRFLCLALASRYLFFHPPALEYITKDHFAHFIKISFEASGVKSASLVVSRHVVKHSENRPGNVHVDQLPILLHCLGHLVELMVIELERRSIWDWLLAVRVPPWNQTVFCRLFGQVRELYCVAPLEIRVVFDELGPG